MTQLCCQAGKYCASKKALLGPFTQCCASAYDCRRLIRGWTALIELFLVVVTYILFQRLKPTNFMQPLSHWGVSDCKLRSIP